MKIRATILQTPSPDRLEVLEDHVVTVGGDGRIETIEPAAPGEAVDITVPDDAVLVPGLVDTHVHAPQWPQLATGLDLPLERWLFEYTFPLEARYADALFAASVWDVMVPDLLAMGTTTAVYYSSIHEPATLALADACLRHGQRAFVGRVAMDHPEGTPEWYRDDDAASAVEASQASIEAIRTLAGPGALVQPIVTPRFIPACTDALLEGLGELAAATGTITQTHCSESDWEHRYVLDRHGRTDSRSLVELGLAGDHAVLAHAVYLSDDDRRLLVERGAGIAHCPLSNAYFANAVFPARGALDVGLRVGLGTDIAGGPEPSLLAQCGHAVTASRMLDDGVDHRADSRDRGVSRSRIDLVTAFWLATVGGAELLGIPAGLLTPGQLFDAVEVDLGPTRPEATDWGAVFDWTVRGGPGRRIERVWVDGRDVTPPRAVTGC